MKVYVSPAQNDLRECRVAVHTATRRLGIEDIAVYLLGRGQPPLEKCLDEVAGSDLYVGLFAWRYGFIPPGSKYSISEAEYRAAVRLNKPCLIFLLAEDAPWPGKLFDHGDDLERIVALRRELAERHVCGFFTNPDDLAAQVTAALATYQSPATTHEPGEQRSTESQNPASDSAGASSADASTDMQVLGDVLELLARHRARAPRPGLNRLAQLVGAGSLFDLAGRATSDALVRTYNQARSYEAAE